MDRYLVDNILALNRYYHFRCYYCHYILYYFIEVGLKRLLKIIFDAKFLNSSSSLHGIKGINISITLILYQHQRYLLSAPSSRATYEYVTEEGLLLLDEIGIIIIFFFLSLITIIQGNDIMWDILFECVTRVREIEGIDDKTTRYCY